MTPIVVVVLLFIAWLSIVIWRNRGPWEPKAGKEYEKPQDIGSAEYIVTHQLLSSDDLHYPGDGHDHGGHHFAGDGHDHGGVDHGGVDHGGVDHAD